jgi:tetratricopeptide (TPR) repeat protein
VVNRAKEPRRSRPAAAARRWTASALVWLLALGLGATAAAQPPASDDPFTRGKRLVDTNCGECAGATRRELERGIAELTKALAAGRGPTAETYRLLGRAYGTLAHVFAAPGSDDARLAREQQREALAKAAQFDPRNADAHYELALALDDPDRQIAALLDALTENPRHVRARFSLGTTFAARGETDEAIAHLTKALALAGPGDAAPIERRLRALRASAAAPVPSPGDAPRPEGCRPIRFAGEVTRGARFERAFTRNLVFVLHPSTDPVTPGWTIEVRHRLYPRPDAELLSLATPPYRFWNPRDLTVSYGWTARQIVETDVRAFRFFARYEDFEVARDALDKLLWPATHSRGAVEDAERRLAALPAGEGTLKIVGSKIDAGTAGGPGHIERLSFEVELCPPLVPVASARLTIRDFNPRALLEGAIRQDGIADPATCARNQPLATVAQTFYADLDGDGDDDVVIGGYSCLSGTAGLDAMAVYRLDAAGHPARMRVTTPGRMFAGRDVFAGLRGRMRLHVEQGRLVQIFPVFRAEDANCCASAGWRTLTYRWTGRDFVLDRVND